MRTLTDIFKEIGHFGDDIGCNDKGSAHTYLDVYENLFSRFKKGCTLLEIGVARGDSLMLWDIYFKNSTIIGVDILMEVKHEFSDRNRVIVIKCDATQPELLNKLDGYEFNIVIDDSSHKTKDQIDVFNLLKSRMAMGSVYIIEDVFEIEQNKKLFKSLHHDCEIIDMRHPKRPDNCLVVFKF